jgi:putative Mg2+ transporter-C (MgtC) family protein
LTNELALTRILIVFVLAGIIGWQREKQHKPAGFRTHVLVGLGSALTMMTGIYMMDLYPNLNVDPARMSAQVISGVGFLGAGTILKERGSIVGLTTASSIWLVACMGLAVGIGFYAGAVAVSLIAFISLTRIGKIPGKVRGHKKNSKNDEEQEG